MQHARSPAKYEQSPPDGEPDFVVLYDVRCPSTRVVRSVKVPCTYRWYRREQGEDLAEHQITCKNCGALVNYRFTGKVVDDQLEIVVLSVLSPQERARS